MSERDQQKLEVESRDETIERVAAQASTVDATTRRRVGRTIAVAAVVTGFATAIAAALVFLVFGVGVPLSIALAVAVGALGGTVVALFVAEQEDGRIERRARHLWPRRTR